MAGSHRRVSHRPQHAAPTGGPDRAVPRRAGRQRLRRDGPARRDGLPDQAARSGLAALRAGADRADAAGRQPDGLEGDRRGAAGRRARDRHLRVHDRQHLRRKRRQGGQDEGGGRHRLRRILPRCHRHPRDRRADLRARAPCRRAPARTARARSAGRSVAAGSRFTRAIWSSATRTASWSCRWPIWRPSANGWPRIEAKEARMAADLAAGMTLPAWVDAVLAEKGCETVDYTRR